MKKFKVVFQPEGKKVSALPGITIAALAAENGVADGFRVIFNNGKKAGQVVFHIHMHIIGGREKPWPM